MEKRYLDELWFLKQERGDEQTSENGRSMD